MKRVAAAGALAVALGLTACTNTAFKPLPPPPTTVAPAPTTTVIDYSGVDLEHVPGRTTTTIPMGPGHSTLNGVVVGPQGAVPGATVRAERLVGDGEASIDVVTAADGTWAIPNVLGGRYRVRAWRPLDLALVTPEVFFLNDGDTKQLQLQLQTYTGLAVTSAVAPSPPLVGQPANLVVQVVQQSVDPDGIVRGQAVPSVQVELFGGGDWSLDTTNPTSTDSQGRAEWGLTCKSTGKQALSVMVGGQQQFPLDIAACEQPPPETTTTSTTSSSSSSSSSTTTSTSR